MIKKEKLLLLVLLNTILAFVVDSIAGFPEFLPYILAIEIPIIVTFYFALKGHKWAFIIAFIYYYIRSFNFYFENFYLMTKNGINIEISINSVAINVISFIFFISLFYELQRKFNTRTTKIIRIVMSIITGLIIILGLLTPKSDEYKESSESTGISIAQDTISKQGIDFTIEIPEDWESADNYGSVSFIAVSPFSDTSDNFRGSLNIQIFDIYDKESDPGKIAEQLFTNGTEGVEYEIEIFSKGKFSDFPAFSYIHYGLSGENVDAASILMCCVKNNKAYSIICTDSGEDFNTNFEDEFKPILKTFRINKP